MEESSFFQIYKLRKKFRYLIHSGFQKNKLLGIYRSCITEKLNGFHIVKVKTGNKTRALYLPIDIIFGLVKHQKIKINCFFST